ncbi:GNAT family N-acetyltransferase [Enterovibrio calviensis]|uniref:GNAT family N-acetyltransferase n=1 Tax=Enterovibrio calviensis TaxID=91359 RepID=UPI0037366AE5
MDIVFIPVNLERDLSTCVTFRRDAWIVSHGSDKGFSEDDAIRWFYSLSEESPDGFFHIWHEKKIIGQLEFKSGIETSDNQKAGYVNLFYLAPAYRGKGLGQVIHSYVVDKLIEDQCVGAMLRYIPGNFQAERFYLKNGWYKSADADQNRGQPMRKDFNE